MGLKVWCQVRLWGSWISKVSSTGPHFHFWLYTPLFLLVVLKSEFWLGLFLMDFLCKIAEDFTFDESIGYFFRFVYRYVFKKWLLQYFSSWGPPIVLKQQKPNARIVRVDPWGMDGDRLTLSNLLFLRYILNTILTCLEIYVVPTIFLWG